MATRIRTLNFLPEVFRTPTNTQFLSATLDQLVGQPNTEKIEGYIGSKFGYGVNAKDKYVVEPTKTRTDYQLDPGVVFTKKDSTIAQDFISYPGIIDGLSTQGGLTQNNNRLFNSQFYSWDSFTDLDKIINFNQYYWLPTGPQAVAVSTDTVFNATSYNVTSEPNGYLLTAEGQAQGTINPTLTLLRGGTYTFTVNQNSQFWIQGAPGVTGYDPVQHNVQTRDVYGVENNGSTVGIVTFTVPQKNAQDEYNFSGNNLVSVVSTAPFDQINGRLLSEIKDIDGITALNGLTVMFYDTGVVNEYGYISSFYDTTLYDQDGGVPYTDTDFPGSSIFNDNFEGGYYSDTSANFYLITYVGDPADPTIKLTESSLIPTNQKITAQYGTEWVARNFYRNTQGTINLIPYLSAIKDVLYYQDGTSSDKVGQIRLIASNTTDRIDILTDIIGRKTYTSPNGVVFTNGLKVIFEGNIYPSSYGGIEYYVQGVGTSIELILVSDLIAPEIFTESVYVPWDTVPWDTSAFDSSLYVSTTPDYITIARNSIDKNAWSRSNRWFHVDVINATAQYNNNPNLVSLYATQANKAKRPIIEFYPNLRLFDSGIIGKPPVDFVDFRTTDAFTYVAGQESYYPDVEVYTAYTASIVGVTGGTSTTITIPASDVSGTFQVGQYVTDSTNLLPNSTRITSITGTATLTLDLSWSGVATFGSTSSASLIANDTNNGSYALFDGARIIFAADTNADVKNKIYVARFSSITPDAIPVITLTVADDGDVVIGEQVVALRGFNYQGKDVYYHEIYDINTNTYSIGWDSAQQKQTLNQPPLFDIFDKNGISFGDRSVYTSSSFIGNKLFAYGIGIGTKDSVLGFPLKYSSTVNVGDISFDVSLNLDVFNYVNGNNPITQKVNTGYVHNHTSTEAYVRELGWQTAVAPSIQYQLFQFDYIATAPTNIFTCDIAKTDTTASKWPTIQLYVNNVIQPNTSYTTTTSTSSTTVIFNVPNPLVDTVIQIQLLSDQVSNTAYYQIPINLNNNPLNEDVTTLNVGDIRGQYQSIFYNSPDTTGEVFGSNNYRDLGNLVPYGNRIIQNSASLVLPGTFIRQQNHNLFNALQFNSVEYINFKTLLIGTVDATPYEVHQTPAFMLDDALDQITSSKTEGNSFFWSDMLPSKASYISNSYSFANSLDTSIYPLSHVYNFETANYNGVLVYLSRLVQGTTVVTQLIKGVDYTVSSTSPSLTITLDLLANDQITINEYTQTYGSYVPNTPTKLGLYPSTIPAVVLDTAYAEPTYFIVGHDGSYNKLYGDYIGGKLIDFRDQVLYEFEKRIYNNLKLSNVIPVQEYEVIPGFFRDTDYSYQEFLAIYSSGFLNWVGQNRITYKTQYYNPNNEYSYNYSQSGNKLTQEAFLQGYWRGIYEYFYDTSNPDTMPWEMLGFTDEPTWWKTRYGAAPYTSDNLILWGDLSAGIDWNNGNPIVIKQAIRPQLLEVLPVDSDGNLVSPFVSVMGDYSNQNFRGDWKVGDVGPAEFSYRRSSSYPFDLMRILALTKPAEFFNLGVDVDNYKYNVEFNQYLVNDRSHLVISDVEIYGNGIAKTSYINWIVDFEKQVGVDATTNITTLLDNLDVRLVYRLAGFSDKDMLKFYVEKATASSANSSLLIPDESYSVLLYENQPFDQIIYSGVVVQSTTNGHYKIFGNSQTSAYFKTVTPKINGNYANITVYGLTVQLANDYDYNEEVLVPYGTEFYTLQEVSQFLENYGRYLESQGVLFDQIETGLEVSWRQMVSELLYWAQSGWEIGSIINLNPAANLISINKDSYIVQPLTLQQQNFILNQNMYPIQSVDLSIIRDGTLFSAQPLNQGDTVAYGQFNISNFEHGIVFNNVTLFDDIIYNLVTGLRQNRITVRGTKTAEWNGTIDAQGFILNQDNIIEWSKEVKYTTGSIVLYKNRYWSAIKIIQAKEVFDERDWKETSYNEIQKGLLPNTSTRSYESTLYYDVNQANLAYDADLLSFSLIGYRPRDYLALADLTDITQINVYKNFIKNKGTKNALSAFKGANLSQGGIDYDVYENWAIKTGEFGGVLNNNFVEFRLNETELTGNPAIVSLTNGTYTSGAQQEIPLYTLFNYGRPITNPDVLSTIPTYTPSTLYPDAGYVSFDDVKIASYYFSGVSAAPTPLSRLYANDYVWVAAIQGSWQVFTPTVISTVILATNNLNGTVSLTFDTPHNLLKYAAFAVVSFSTEIDGYYTVAEVVSPNIINIALTLIPSIRTITGLGIAFKMQSQRVATPSDINNLPLLNSEFVKNKIWVDENNDGNWAVFRKSINYNYVSEVIKDGSQTFGSAVAHTNNLGYLISDADVGEVYRYVYDPLLKDYRTYGNALVGAASFGTTIEYADDIFVISQPFGATEADRTISIYQLVITRDVNELQLLQTIIAPSSGVTNWGSAIAISGDKNWLYVSDTVHNTVYAYRKSEVTGLYQYSTTLSTGTSSANDNFGYSISTDYYGTTVLIGAPNQNYDVNTNDWGYSYVYDRLYQNLEVQYTSIQYVPQIFNLAVSVTTISTPVTATQVTTNLITCGSTSGFVVGMPIMFTGSAFGGIAENKVYYIKTIAGGTTFTISATRGGSAIVLVNASGTITAAVQSTPIYVSVNGTSIADNNYAVVGTRLYVTSSLTAGDIISVSTNNFVWAQTLTTEAEPKIGVQFGHSSDTNAYATELLVGAPFEVSQQTGEGAVYRYTNAAGKYGAITGTTNCNITAPFTILINGYAVTLPIGWAGPAATAINEANITNVQAADLDGLLSIQLIDVNLANANDKLNLSVFAKADLAQMGMTIFTQTQVINDPHTQGTTQFGTQVKFNEFGSFVATAPTGTRFAATTFDFSDDENNDNDTLFDNNGTQWVDTFANAGSAYMFDYLPVYNESISNTGQFTYAQSVNARNEYFGLQPLYGTSLDFNNSSVLIGAPNFNDGISYGQVIVYDNTTGEQDWSVYRSSAPIVDISRVQNIQMFSAETNDTLAHLDYIDPLQGKLLGIVSENLDYVSNIDPAGYNSTSSYNGNTVWGPQNLGQLWFDTSSTKFVNYHQNDNSYNSKYWGRVFPGSDVAVYSWISSNVPPSSYAGRGTPYNPGAYAFQYVTSATGAIVPVYYYWVRNTGFIFNQRGKTLADITLQNYIFNPIVTGVSFFAPLLPNTFALYNTGEFINALDSVLHVGFSTGTSDDVSHSLYSLIREDFADDFLPGLPNNNVVEIPESLYNRMLDSMCGVDEGGANVPNPFLPKPVQSGILARPRQSFFRNRFGALENYLTYANEVLAQFPIVELRNSPFLKSIGATNPTTGTPFYDVASYWSYVNWWATGYNNNTKSALQVPIYADLATLGVPAGTIVRVATNGQGTAETYRYDGDSIWTRIGLDNGTIAFSSVLWDYPSARLGFGDNFFDTTPFDEYPSTETRYIVRALNEQLYIDDLQIYRNKSLILVFEYIQSETIETQNYLPWLNKTSFVDVSHTIRELLPYEVFTSDNQAFLSGYVNEVKPYHVVIKDFLFKYTKTDVFDGDITDFDLPAQYNTTYEQFITPELVYANPSGNNQYLPSDPIWQTAPYTQWFNNYGLGITGVDNYPITLLTSYITLISPSFTVDNAYGFPINGVVNIGGEEIAYASVNTATGVISGLTRGINGTAATSHIPGEQIYINLPPVLLLDGGNGYTEPPKITAYIDTSIYPAPTRPAVLQAVMYLDTILSVDVIDSGAGYAVLPEIVIDPSTIITFDNTAVNIITDTITLGTQVLQTAGLIRYTVGADTTPVGGLSVGSYYYINVLETVPVTVIALYTNYADAINDTHRVKLFTTGNGTTNNLSLGGKASCVTSSAPIRENQISLRFDRTSYTSQVVDWTPGSFYGAFYAGVFNNSTVIASSAITLEQTQPLISTIAASAQGTAFEIMDVTNDSSLTWSSRTRNVIATTSGVNAITIEPSDGGAALSSNVGPTTGFYVGMPVKFVGTVIGNLVENTTYYVKSIIDLSNFTISATITDGIPGSVFALTTSIVPTGILTNYIGEVVDTAVLTINYPDILQATATAAITNYITTPLTITGQGGTTGFYVGLPIAFTGTEFGGIVVNKAYYVTTIVDSQTFTMSTTNDPLILDITATSSSGNLVTCNSTLGLNVNDPIIFTGTTFGGIIAGQTYYVSSYNGANFTISTSPNGGDYGPLSDDTGTCSATSQKDTVQLTTATGSMTLTAGLPVSPGQINGQEFNFYITSNQYSGVTGTTSNGLTRVVTQAIVTGNYLTISDDSGGLTDLFVGMPITFPTTYGGFGDYTTNTYTVSDTGIITDTVTNTSSTGNLLTCGSTSGFYVGMPVVFGNESLGNALLNVTYYVKSIPGSTTFTISQIPGGATFVLANDNGSMTVTGESYIRLDTIVTVNETSEITISQTPTVQAVFDVSYILGGYRIIITTPGEGYAIGNTITIAGTSVGGLSPKNNVTLTVTSVDTSGGITTAIVSGTPFSPIEQFYLKVINANQCEVYYNQALTLPVNGNTFVYSGVRSTTATIATASNDRFTVTSSADFSLYDPVVFTGTVFGGVVLGETYYIKSKPTSTTVTISETVGGATFNIASSTTGSMTMAKSGDYALLPNPFYFDQSLVKYNNNVYQCVVSNNDPTFVIGKWELMSSGSRKLNALDRIVGYYQPTVNMPGLDLTQLVTGITYPNSTYLDNAFAPANEFALDTILQDQVFYPTGINSADIMWDGTRYLVPANSADKSILLSSTDGVNWAMRDLANNVVSVTSILVVDGTHIITTKNNATPIYRSIDGVIWSVLGQNNTGTSVESTLLNSVAYLNDVWVAVGENIVTSTNTENWVQTYEFTNNLTNTINGVTGANTPGFVGFIAVGATQQIISGNAVNINLLLISIDGVTWTSPSSTLTSYAMNAVTATGDLIVIVGDHGTIFTSTNGSTWTQRTSGTTANLNDVVAGDSLYVLVGDAGLIKTSTNGITWTTRSSGTSQKLNGVTYDGTSYVVVGDSNVIITSTDGSTWTSTSMFDVLPTVYDVQGDAFESGYGPEELVPGVVTDNLSMIVTTRPGTTWDATVYQHVGYQVVSSEITPTSGSQTVYSFAKLVEYPIQLSVFVIDGETGLSTSIYTNAYSVDWINKTITLNTPLAFSPITNRLRIDVYETGNGNQLVKSDSLSNPVTFNSTTGFNEIELNCNYSASISAGSGVVRPGSESKEVTATKTESSSNSITCASIDKFTLDSPITFQGAVFGGIQLDTVYYVKTISTASNKITVSTSISSGIAGPTFILSDDTGTMQAVVQSGNGLVWTPPVVNQNGIRLNFGVISEITRTNGSTNIITCNSTDSVSVNDTVTFSSTVFGGVIQPLTIYYIKEIISANSFTISETLGGATLELSDATGGALMITNDYAFTISANGITATMVLSAVYDSSVDVISYTIFGETAPEQYSYTLPETQVYTVIGTETQFTIDNFVGGTNPTNAIVEYNGRRLVNISDYTINSTNNTLNLNFSTSPGSTVAVTSFNSTERQYLNTVYGGLYNGSIVNQLTVGSTTNIIGTYDQDTPTAQSFDQDTPSVVLFDEDFNYLTLSSGSTSTLNINDGIEFVAPTIGGIVAGQTYYVASILNSTDFTISLTAGGEAIQVTNDSGAMDSFTTPPTVANIININNVIAPPLAQPKVTATASGTNLITCASTGNFVVNQLVIFKAPIADAAGLAVGHTYQITDLGTTTQSQWNTIAGTSGVVYAVGDIILVAAAGTGTGSALLTSFGGINLLGEYYYIASINGITTFTIKDINGTTVALSNDTGLIEAFVGGNPAISITTGIPNNLVENDLVRIDGVSGSTQLNNNTYYAKIVSPTQILLYETPYDPAYGALNYPVLNVFTYTGGGYVWLDKLFTLTNATATATITGSNLIEVNNNSELVPGTPVIFTGTTFGGITAGLTYYVRQIVGDTYFTVSETRGGDEVLLSDDTGRMNVTEWEQMNVDRLWVTVNGYRVPSSSLYLNPNNNLSILTTIVGGDVITITNMIPTATPNEMVYIQNVNQTNEASVYRANSQTRTWLTYPLYDTATVIYLNDVSKVTQSIVQEVTTPAEVDGVYSIGLTADKRLISQVIVYNNTTSSYLDSSNYFVQVIELSPILQITAGVSAGDSLTITTIVGKLIVINGEQIYFKTVNLENNTLSGLQRGANGTGEQTYIPEYSAVYGVLSSNRLSQPNYYLTWNSYVYNTVEGDPLQISDTYAATFLNDDFG